MTILAEAFIAAFDSNAQITWTTESASVAIASFSTNEAKVVTRFSKVSDDEWQVGFEVSSDQQSAPQIPHSFIRILGGVFQSVREFLEVRQPMKLVFTNEEEALGRLYESYLERQDTVLSQMGYEMVTPTQVSPLVEFVIRKKTPSEWRD
jgi:hypothetical protein